MGRYFIVTPLDVTGGSRFPLDEAQVAILIEGRIHVYIPNIQSWVFDSALQDDFFLGSPGTHFEEVPENFAVFMATSLRRYSSVVKRMMVRDAGAGGVVPLKKTTVTPPTSIDILHSQSNTRDPNTRVGLRFTVQDEEKFRSNFAVLRQPVIKAMIATRERPRASLFEIGITGSRVVPREGWESLVVQQHEFLDHKPMMDVKGDLSIFDIKVRDSLSKEKGFGIIEKDFGKTFPMTSKSKAETEGIRNHE